ncbi:MAG: ribonucleotide-diphosphate reductase subunit beta, partial [Caulobacteraceae bacterium]
KDWAAKLNDRERNLLTQIFRFFTQSDVEVNDNYLDRYAAVFRPTEVRMMLAAFSNMETIHIAAYALLLETIGMPETEFSAFMDLEALKAKHDYMQRFGVDSDADIARTLAMFGGFTEGLQLFASFAMLMNFPRFNKMKGMGQIISWSVRDESLHCEGIIKLFHAFNAETKAVTKSVADDIVECCRTVVGLEDRFIDLAFEAGEVQGMTAEDIKGYIRFIADWRLRQLNLPVLYGARENPLPWLQSLLSGVEHANFFEARATEYSKAASRGAWHGEAGVWSEFDRLIDRRGAPALQ